MNIAVIFAGGVGSRMHSKDRPKQFLEMYNKPIIIHTLEYFENHSMIDAIVVVCIKDWIPYLNKLLYKFRIEKVKSVVPGGETGQLSIYNGLKSAKQIAKDEKSIVLIHDGVRPLINEKVISDNIQSVIKYGSAITTAKVKETIGYINPLKVRSNYPESKRLCENMCVAYMREYGVKVKIARLAQTFGAGILPGENRVFAQFAKSVISGRDIVLHTRGLSEGNYCYTRDCVLGLFIILLCGENGEAYNVANPKSHTTIAEMAHMVADKISNGKIKVIYDIPKDNVFGYAEDTKMKLNSDKLQALGWTPEIGLEDAYKRMIEQMKIEGI